MAIPCTTLELENKKFVECPAGSGKVAVRTKICSENDEPIFIKFESSTRTNIYGEALSSADTEVLVVSYTLAQSLVLCDIGLSTNIEGVGYVYLNDTKIRALRTSPSEKNPSKPFSPNYRLTIGDKLEIKFKARANSASTDIEAYIDLIT
jgi:hypothetical protein